MVRQDNGVDIYTIRASDGSAEAEVVPAFGAIVSSLRLPWHGTLREVLYQHPFFWDAQSERTRGGYPFLFPICGRLERDGAAGAYLYDGQVYQMKNHGFSMRMPWRVVEAQTDALTVTLNETPETLRVYPFRFAVTLRIQVGPGRLVIEQSYANAGPAPMPYYAGFHPYYLTPPVAAGKDRVQLDYKARAQLCYNARLTDLTGRAEAPALPRSITAPDLNERLTEVAPGTDVVLAYPDGILLHTLAEGVEDPALFPLVQLYTMDDRPFFCVEPWMGFPNAMNTIKGCRWLAPGQCEHGRLKVWTSC